MLYSPKWKNYQQIGDEINPIPVLDEVGRQLMRAADIMEQRGHCREWLYDDRGRVCVQRAIQLAHPLEHDWQAVERFCAYTGYRFHTGYNKTHSKEECVAAMRAAAWHK